MQFNLSSRPKKILLKSCFSLILFLNLFICFAGGQQEEKTSAKKNKNASVVKIIRAQSTETKKDKKTGRNLVSFTGDVYLTIERERTVVSIYANTVNFDRERNMLYAADDVRLEEVVENSMTRNLSGSSLIMNVNTFEGVFDDVKLSQTQFKASKNTADSIMIISSDIFARDDSGVVTFKKSTITFCDDENPHWKIKASRVWLLPDNEFAFANALLFIGNVPIFYLPFFYYPKDEMIFNPVFGYRPRVGYYTQTTTYLIGRKPLSVYTDDDESSLSFINPNQLMEQRREGLFLRNLDTPLSEDRIPTDYLKLMGDVYSNLGVMTGIEGSFKPKDNFFNKVDFSALIGFSRNLYEVEENAMYSPYDIYRKSVWNTSNFFGKKLPFRYSENIDIVGSTDTITFSLNMPLYSDPFFKSDFGDRKEHMDWLNYMTQSGLSSADELKKAEAAEISSYSWKLSFSYKPKFDTDLFKFSLNSLTSSLDWATKEDPNADEASPERKFFYPSRITPVDAKATISGVLYEYSSDDDINKNIIQPKEESDYKPDEYALMLDLPDGFPASGESGNEGNDEEIPLPVLNLPKFYKKNITDFRYRLSYVYNPSFISLYNYSPDTWGSASDSAWKDYTSNFLSLSGTANVSSEAVWKNGFFTLNNQLIFNHVYHKHPEISSKYYTTAAAVNQVLLSDYTAKKIELVSKNEISIKPFVLMDMFEDTAFFYKAEFKLLRTEFNGSATGPSWKYLPTDWTKDSFVVHEVGVTASAKADDFVESLTVKSQLPPLLPKYTATMNLEAPHVKAKLESGYAMRSEDDKTWYVMPLTEDLSVDAFNNKLAVAQSYKYSWDTQTHEYMKVSATYGGFALDYSELNTTGYTYSMVTGWKTNGIRKFRPYQLAVKYSTPEKKYYYFWKNRIALSPTLSTSIVADLIRPPLSYFTFNPSVTLKINEFLDLTFASTHRNDVIFRYVQNGVNYSPKLPGETNIIKDLMDSFDFAEEVNRLSSGFKLKTLSMELNHDLHDWTVNSRFEIEPQLIKENGYTRYDYSPYFSVSVVWKPMSGVRAKIVDDKGTVELNP